MNKKKLLILIGGGLAIAILLIMVVMSLNNKPVNAPTGEGETPGNEQVGEIDNNLNTPPVDEFREETPDNIVVPGMDEAMTDAQKEITAVPSIVTPAAPGASSSFRSFTIKGEGGKFTPSEVIARLGDVIHINFTAVDKPYDIVFPSYSMRQNAKQGETKILEFQAISEGSFTYFCDSCGGADGPTKGKVIVVK